MATEKFGIENLKLVLKFGVSFGTSVADALGDKKISFYEGLALVAQLSQVAQFAENKDAIIAEAKDLSFDEIEELINEVKDVITSEEVVATIEDGLAVAIAIKNSIERFGKKKGDAIAGATEIGDGTIKE